MSDPVIIAYLRVRTALLAAPCPAGRDDRAHAAITLRAVADVDHALTKYAAARRELPAAPVEVCS